jgi:histone acetyltransferase
MLTTFPTPWIPDIESLSKQLLPFHRPTGGKTGGKKPAQPMSISAIDISTPDPTDAATPGMGSEQDEVRPSKRRRLSGDDGDEEVDDPMGSPKQGKKPSGKTTGRKERMPRTLVRSTRGLIPMETESDGTQHVGGQLPDTVALDGVAVKALPEGVTVDQEDLPAAQQRPQLEEGERKRREIAKEKEKEREVEVLRNQRKEDVEIWEGVELVCLPPHRFQAFC